MKYFLLLCLLFATTAHAQINDSDIKANMRKLDTMNAQLNESIKQSMHRMDSEQAARSIAQMNKNLDSFMAQRREQEKKNKQRMYLRLGFGVLMLAVLVVGMRRKKKVAAKVE